MDILFLGTSGKGVKADRNLPSLIIDRSILFDCGEGCLQSLRKSEIRLEEISQIFITHFHADHVLGIISIIYAMVFYDKIGIVPPIYVPEGMKSNLLSFLENTYSMRGIQRFNINLDIIELPLSCSKPIEIENKNGRYTITWQQTIHDPICLSYKINNKVVYTGDTAFSKDIISFTTGATVLIHEASFPDEMEDVAKLVNHSTAKQAAIVARDSGVEHLYLFHTPDITDNSDKFLIGAKSIFPNLKLANDLEEIKDI